MAPEQRQAKIKKNSANRASRQNTPSKYSIALENPGYVELGDEVIFDDDTDQESDMFDDQVWMGDEDIEINDVVDSISKSSSVPDPYEIVYSNIPQNTHAETHGKL
ncbi:hypothetical protein E2562_005604 [Oryza meyeriana var. granulata]|uniref:Uncharacterized protein n=1 Tax=Oryza meyeriana var. granulata TaxID=110450 RepID=A0A6G1F413_9ORYZ|nr:hypothetical protein E2562_005604 [Oryza meyeriana var. granulata]